MAAGDRLFGDMSRPEHAYALGIVAAAGRLDGGVLEIALRGDGQPLLALLGARTASDVPALYEVRDDKVRIAAPLGALAREFLGAPPGERDALRFPELPVAMSWAFLRGLFDASGKINAPKSAALEVTLEHPGARLLPGVLELIGAPPQKTSKRRLTWTGSAALDLLGHLYDEFVPPDARVETQDGGGEQSVGPRLLGSAPPPSAAGSRAESSAGGARSLDSARAAARRGLRRGPERSPFRPEKPKPSAVGLYREKHLRRYWRWCQRIVHVRTDGVSAPVVQVSLVHPRAVVPRKERVSDSGYDLTLVYEKSRHGNVVFYGTGVIVEPPQGWYFDVVARSSIVKRGYMLANNVGIIDRAYRGEILVPLVKLDPNAPDLELPARVTQLIPRPIAHFPVRTSDELTQTQRGSGGFGSTG